MHSDSDQEKAVFTVRDLSLQAGDRPILKSINFTIPQGSCTGLLGQSGAGKSLLSKAMIGMLPRGVTCSGGSLELEHKKKGKVRYSANGTGLIPTIRGAGGIGYVMQDGSTSLNPAIRCGLQVLECLLPNKDISPDEKKRMVLKLFEDLDFDSPEKIYNAYPHELSGGQRQRVVIAIAVVNKPSIVVADEPTAGLDVLTERQVLKLLNAVTVGQGIGLLLISHDLGVLHANADYLLVLDKGEIVETGPVQKVIGSPGSRFMHELVKAYKAMHSREPSKDARFQVRIPVLDVEGVTRIYTGKRGTIRAVDNISFSMGKGELLAIAGVSGSGKSTLGLLVAGLLDRDGGHIVVSETEARKEDGNPVGIQMLFQDAYAALYPHKTLAYALQEALVQSRPGMSKSAVREKMQSLMTTVDLDPAYLVKYPHQLSGGERQRFQIARALAMHPQILICDESLEGLDLPVQIKVMEILNRLRARENLAIVFITHHLSMARRFADRILILEKGKVVDEGNPVQLFLHPGHPYTKALVAAETAKQVTFPE